MSDSKYLLHTVGWKAFQDLCADLVRVHWKTEVEVYSPVKDDGVDGIVSGLMLPGKKSTLPSGTVIQAKHSSRANAKLSATALNAELDNIRALAKQGTKSYILLTSMSVSHTVADSIRDTVKSAGIPSAEVLGSEWITQIIESTPALRALVPRVYGLGDFSWILDERRIAQTREILSGMQHELSLYVTTDAHRRAVTALIDHGFVLLLGEPASGKSSIAAVLAATALDLDAQNVVRAYTPQDVLEHWNPHEKNRFFWVDDAFGPTQLQPAMTDGWNRIFPTLRAAIKSGNRFVLTSRSYIWNQAKELLKLSAFPPLTTGQVVIDLNTLTKNERHQILYNHLKFGDQHRAFRSAIKPHLEMIAENRHFLPETARRLGNSFFTRSLGVDKQALDAFVTEPKAMLSDLLSEVGASERAVVALLFVSSGTSPSPILNDDSAELVCRLFGINFSQLIQTAEALNGTLINRVVVDGRQRWIFKHPTIGDAFADYLRTNPELADLFIGGAKLSAILREVVCEGMNVPGAQILITLPQQDVLMGRLLSDEADWRIRHETSDFLAVRADRRFLLKFLSQRPSFLKAVANNYSSMQRHPLLQRLADEHRVSALPESVRDGAREAFSYQLKGNYDASLLKSSDLKALVGADFIGTVLREAKDDLLPYLESLIDEHSNAVDSDTDIDQHFDRLASAIWTMGEYFDTDDEATNLIDDATVRLDETIEDLKRKQRRNELSGSYDSDDDWSEAAASRDDTDSKTVDEFNAQPTVSIFDDVDV